MPKKRTGNKSLLLSTPVYNELADAAEWVKFHRMGPRFDTRRSAETQSWIWLRNDTGGNLVPGNIVGIGPPTVNDSQNPVSFQYQVAHQAVLPTIASHATRLAVVLDACPPGEWFAGLVAGVASVNIYVSAALARSPASADRIRAERPGRHTELWAIADQMTHSFDLWHALNFVMTAARSAATPSES